MIVAARGGYSRTGLALVLVLHAVLFYALLHELPRTKNVAPIRYSQMLFVRTLPPKSAVEVSEPPRRHAVKARSEKPIAVLPRIEPRIKLRVDTESSLPVAETPPPVIRGDPFREAARIDIGALVKQAGKADRETRSDREVEKYGPTADSMEAVMTRAFHAAKLAVPLKWYEAAHIELFSAPNDPKPIYQVKTAFGTYCLYYPDKLREGTGPPRIAGCPHVLK